MNVAAPEATEYDSVSAGDAVDALSAAFAAPAVHERESSEATTFECLFCRRSFGELPFYGCCGGCYTSSADVRALVDAAHPQTAVA